MVPIGWVLGYFANTSGLGSHVDHASDRGVSIVLFDELLRLGGLRLHGRPDWFVQ